MSKLSFSTLSRCVGDYVQRERRSLTTTQFGELSAKPSCRDGDARFAPGGNVDAAWRRTVRRRPATSKWRI
jgi:hypothetical protein